MYTILNHFKFICAVPAAIVIAMHSAYAQSDTVSTAPCVAEFTSADAIVIAGDRGGYDGFDPSENIEALSIAVRLVSGNACRFAVVISSDGGPNLRTLRGPQGASLGYQLLKSPESRDILINSVEPQRDAVLPIELSTDNPTEVISYFANLPAGQIVKPGSYSGRLTLTLFEVIGVEYEIVTRTETAIRTTVPSKVDVSISLSDRDFDVASTGAKLELGDLSQGARAQAFVQVRSNNDFLVSVQSDRQGALQYNSSNDVFKIPYNFTLSGESIPLNNGVIERAIEGVGPTPSTGNSYRIVVDVPTPTTQRAGVYNDTIRFRVRPAL